MNPCPNAALYRTAGTGPLSASSLGQSFVPYQGTMWMRANPGLLVSASASWSPSCCRCTPPQTSSGRAPTPCHPPPLAQGREARFVLVPQDRKGPARAEDRLTPAAACGAAVSSAKITSPQQLLPHPPRGTGMMP